MNTPSREQLIDELLTRSVDSVVDKNRLRKRLLAGEKLRVKLGIDPTSPHIHLGRSVPLLKLRAFQKLGCKIVLIIGDFTGVIGDTSDKTSERPMLSSKEVKQNLKTYIQQFGKLVDVKKTEVQYNSKWLGKLSYWEVCVQADLFSLNEFSARTNIKTRIEKGGRVSLRETLYPLMVGFDSVKVKADVEIGGVDQWFNLLAGRTLQKHYGQEPQDILTTALVEGLDGRKMSSSWGNTINLTDEPQEMYGKIMSMTDALIIPYFLHCTEVSMPQIRAYEQRLKTDGSNPRDVKADLAFVVTELYWGSRLAQQAKEYFNAVIRDKKIPNQLNTKKVRSHSLVDVLVETGLVGSKSEARRVIEQGGVQVDGQPAVQPDQAVASGSVIQKGKRNFVKILR